MQAVGLQTYIWNNNIRSAVLLAGFPVLLVGMVFVLTLGMIWGGMLPSTGTSAGDMAYALRLLAAAAPAAIAVAAIWFAIAYVFNQSIIDMATGSRKVERPDQPELYNLLENLCISRGMKTPAIRIIEADGMNAFASGLHEGRFSITVTRGLLSSLTRDELAAVLAHELTLVINRYPGILARNRSCLQLLCAVGSRQRLRSCRDRPALRRHAAAVRPRPKPSSQNRSEQVPPRASAIPTRRKAAMWQAMLPPRSSARAGAECHAQAPAAPYPGGPRQ